MDKFEELLHAYATFCLVFSLACDLMFISLIS